MAIADETSTTTTAYWHPFADMGAVSRSELVIERGEGVYVYDADGRVSYALLAKTNLFRRGIARLKTGMADHRISIMCAEREPLDCHRTILVSRELAREGVPVTHILADGSLETHDHAMERLIASMKLSEADLFGNPIDRALDLRASKMGYVKKNVR